VYSCGVGGVTVAFWLDTANDEISYFSSGFTEDFPDLAISGDGSTVDAAGEWTDSLLNPQTVVTYIDWETWFPLAADGQKLNQDGSLLFSPLTDGIDVIAQGTGHLLYRVQIPVTPAPVYDALVVAGGQNTLAVITADGVSFVDLSTLRPATQSTHKSAHTILSKTAKGRSVKSEILVPSNRSAHWDAIPKLRHRVEKSKTYTGTR
jgi:hypothetical protein